MLEPVVVIVNPASAGGRTAKTWPGLAEHLNALGVDFAAFPTTGPLTATALTRQALQKGAQTIVAVGGDGTINEIVNGFYVDDKLLNPAARLAIIPSGTGRDLPKTLGIPPGSAALPCLVQGRERTIDLGRATFLDHAGHPTQRYFINIVDLGLGGETVLHMNQASKMLGGFLAFLYGAVAGILKHHSWLAELSVDDESSYSIRTSLVLLANGQYFGGGMHVAPGAELDDGYFDLMILGGTSKLHLIFSLLPKVYRGRHLDDPRVSCRRARRVSISSADRVLMQMDGELVGTNDATIEMLPGALKLLVPADAALAGAVSKDATATSAWQSTRHTN